MNISSPAIPPPPNARVILPDELIIEILSWLNVKSLMAVKCVCKSWNTLICDPVFIKKHLNLSKRNPHLALLSKGYPNKNKTAAAFSVTRLLESTSNSIDPYFRFNNIDCDGIVGSCNGLICLHRYYYWCGKHLYYFCNLATGTKSETLLSLPWCTQTMTLGFGYDTSSDRYKAVMLGFNIDYGSFRKQVTTTAKVFTLGDNIWRDIQSFFPVEVASCSAGFFIYDGVYLSNSISWLFQKNLKTEQLMIISLDLGTETYTQLLLPSCCDELRLSLYNSSVCVLMDCICFFHGFRGTHLVIWKMKEFGVDESWTQFLKISYLNLGINYDRYCYAFAFQVVPLYLSENDTTLILAKKARNQAILYNWRDNRVKEVENANGILWYAAKDYVESLVSTC